MCSSVCPSALSLLVSWRTHERRRTVTLNVSRPGDLRSLPLETESGLSVWMSKEHKTSLEWFLKKKKKKPFVRQSTRLGFDQNCFVCAWPVLILTCDPYWSGSLFTSPTCCDPMWPLETRALKYTIVMRIFFVKSQSLFSHVNTEFLHVSHPWTTRVCEPFVFYKDSVAKGWPLVWQKYKL